MRLLLLFLAVANVAQLGCNKPAASKDEIVRPELTFMTNGPSDFWKPAEAGAKQAGRDYGAVVHVTTPTSMTDQTRKLEDLLTRGTDGVAVSPISPENQADVLNRVAEATNLIAHDSDAPNSNRRIYVGMDNYEAGLMCGKLVRKAIPDGGTIMIFIGRLDQDNSRRRRQGCIDGILAAEPDPNRTSAPGDEMVSEDGKYRVLGTLTDNFDRAKAKANAEDTLTRHPDINAMVGLFEYNPPLILEALDRAGRLNQVQVIGFDENFATLQGIIDGTVVGTIVQDPFQYGYESIRLLRAMHAGKDDLVPAKKSINIPARVIDQSNVEPFWQDLRSKLGQL
ncbi:sugar-binding protein [Pirellulales bacterium]|nr:sugar-binding protein [Pirellulales bacterium]